MRKEQKRFIAGAICPRCAELDKLFVYKAGDRTFRECVNCDFLEEQKFAPIAREPATRVTDNAATIETVRIIEPGKAE